VAIFFSCFEVAGHVFCLQLSFSVRTISPFQGRGEQRLQPEEIYQAVVEQGLDTLLQFQAFAARQFAADDKRWLNAVMKNGAKKVFG
jgi:hypothetical protein